MEATLAHVAVGCRAATNALSVPGDGSSAASWSGSYAAAFAARNEVALLRCGVGTAGREAPLTVVETLKPGKTTADGSRLTCVRLFTEQKTETVQVLAGDSTGRAFLWTKTQDGDWTLQQVTEDEGDTQLAVAAVAMAQTSRRLLHVVALSDGSLSVFGQCDGSGDVKLLTKMELGVNCIMEAVEATVECADATSGEESVLVAAGGVDSKVHLLEVAGGSDALTPLMELEGHRGWIRSLAFQKQQSRDGGVGVVMLASASQDQRIRLWKITACSRGDANANGATNSSAAGEVHDGFLAVGQRTVYTVSFDALLLGHEDWVTSVQWMQLLRDDASSSATQEDPCVLSSSMDNTLIVWKKSVGSCGSWSPSLRIGEMGGNGLLSGGVLPSHSGQMNLLSLNFSGQLERWEQQPAPSKRFLPAISVSGHCAEVTDLSWSPRGDYFVSVSLDQTARVVAPSVSEPHADKKQAISAWHEISRAQVHGYDINCGCFVLGDRSTNDQFVSGADEKILRVFEAPDEMKRLVNRLKQEGATATDSTMNTEVRTHSVHHAYLPELSLTNKSVTETPASTSESSGDGYAKLYHSLRLPVGDTLSRKTLWPEQRKLYGHGNELLSVTSSHSGDLIASACKSREERFAAVRLWNTSDWSEAQEPLAGHKSSVVQLAFSPNDQFLLSVSRDRQFCLYERQLESGGKFALVEHVKAHRRIIWSCSWSPDSSMFALGSRDQSFSLWSQSLGKWGRVCDPVILEAAITAVAFSSCEMPTDADTTPAYLLAVGLETGAIWLFTVSKPIRDSEQSTATKCTLLSEIPWELSASGSILRLAWGPTARDGECMLAVASSDTSVRVFTLKRKI